MHYVPVGLGLGLGSGLGSGLGLGLGLGGVRVRVRGGVLPATSHSIFYTTVNAEGSPSGGLSWDICRHRMGPHSNDAGTLAA